MIIIFFLLFILFIAFLNRIILKNNYKIANPVTILCLVWGMVYIVHSLYFEQQEYTLLIYCIIIVSLLCFAIPFWILSQKNITIKKNDKCEKRSYWGYNNVCLKKVLYLISIVEFFRVSFYFIYVVYFISGSWSFFISNTTQVRLWYMHSSPGLLFDLFQFITNSVVMIGEVLLGVFISNKNKKGFRLLIFWTASELVCAIVTMSKMSFVIYLMVVAISYVNNLTNLKKQKKIIKKLIPFILVIFIVFFLYIGYQRNYMAQGKLNDVVFNGVIDYFAGPTEALGVWINENTSPLTLGTSTLSFINGIMKTLGIKITNPSMQGSGFVDIGRTSTNVFTWLLPFYNDFSYAGFIIIPGLLGFIAGALYNQKEHNLFIDTCNSWLSVLLALSFFDFMWNQTIYIFILFLAYFLHIKYKEKLYAFTPFNQNNI